MPGNVVSHVSRGKLGKQITSAETVYFSVMGLYPEYPHSLTSSDHVVTGFVVKADRTERPEVISVPTDGRQEALLRAPAPIRFPVSLR